MSKARILKKLGSEQGETLAEALVAILISSLAMLMLSTAISGSFGIVKNSIEVMETYYNGLVNLASHADADSPGTVTIRVGGAAGSSVEVDAEFFEDAVGAKPVIAYEKSQS